MLTVSECTFGTERTFTHLPVSANFSFELLLKVRLSSHDFSGLNGNNIQVRESAELVIDLGFISRIFVTPAEGHMEVLLLGKVVILVHEVEVEIVIVDHNGFHVHVNVGHLSLTWVVH